MQNTKKSGRRVNTFHVPQTMQTCELKPFYAMIDQYSV